MSKKIRYSLLAILALVMAFGMIGSAAAQAEGRPLRGRGGLRGSIIAIEGSALTLEVRENSAQIITNDETRFHIIGQESAGLADFSVGDTILARGQRQDDDAMLAALIVRQPDGDVVLGRIVAIEADGLRLNGRNDQEISVSVSPETLIALRRQELIWDGDPAGKDALREGMTLAAFGAAGDDGTSLDAHTLVVLRAQPQPQRRGRIGTIANISADSFTLTTPQGEELAVTVTEETRYRLPGIEDPGLEDFTDGDEALVIGQPGAEGEAIARIVAAVPENRPQGRPVAGEITAINGNEISLTTLRGEPITVSTNADTIFRIGRDNEAALSDFTAGDKVIVFGTRGKGDGTVMATHVMKRG